MWFLLEVEIDYFDWGWFEYMLDFDELVVILLCECLDF